MNKVLRLSVVLALALSATLAATAQGGPVCSVNNDTVTPNCSGSTWLTGLTSCQHKTISCPTVNGVSLVDIGITFGYKNPTATPNGTIVFFSEGGGKTTDDPVGGSASKTFAAYYNAAPYNYQVVQTAWDSSGPDWEDTGTTTKNIAYAAGRPSAFLSWVNVNLYKPIHLNQNTHAGMCVQGTSAGGAAALYALAWYGATYIDKVSLLSSPPLSDIEAGCEQNPGIPSVQVCPTGQLGCNVHNSPSSWTQSPSYTIPQLNSVRTWTGDTSGDSNSCRPDHGYSSGTADAAWKAESIVDGAVGTFNYPNTQITSWLCSSVKPGDGLMNNSSPEAELFFQQFTSSSQIPKGLTINGVGSCAGSEQVGEGTPPSNYVTLGYATGGAAIEYDMTADSANLCTSHH